jgi:GT2 family glycosyltransferase
MVSIIILNYNRKEDIIFTLEMIYQRNKDTNKYEIIVIDQNSNDGSQETIKKNFPNILLYCSETNLGVAGGRNKGAELAKGDILVFIDDDSHFLTDGSVVKIKKIFTLNPNVGIIGFKILDKSKNIRDWVYHKNTLKQKNNIFETQQYVGCGHAIRSNLFHEMNGYSKYLFFWGEEIEFSIKTFAYSNYKIIYYPHIEVMHRVSDKSRYYWSDKRTYFQTRNRFIIIRNYFKKYFLIKSFYSIYYTLGYFIKARRNSALKYYYKGLKESRKFQFDKFESPRNDRLKDYFKLYIKQICGKVRKFDLID